MATSYHQLGMVAQQQGDLDEAHDWYRKSLDIKEQLGNRPGMAMSYGQLGLLAEDQGDGRTALAWTVRCVTLFEQFPHPATGPAPHHLARLTEQLGAHVLDEVWREVTGHPVPDGVLEQLG